MVYNFPSCLWQQGAFNTLFTFLFTFFVSPIVRFINARRRIVQPLIDQSNRAGAPGEFILKILIFFLFSLSFLCAHSRNLS